MSQTFTISEVWMEHEGGTKFYHPIHFSILNDEGMLIRAATALHYAGFMGNFEKFRRPVSGGQVKIAKGAVYQERISEKSKHYRAGPGAHRSQSFDSLADFRAVAIEMMGRPNAERIFLELGISLNQQDDEIILSEAEARPKTPGEDEPTDFADRPAAWGTW